MDLEQLVMVALILIIVYMLVHVSQTSKTQKPQSDRVVYLKSPYIGRGFSHGPWSGPRPGIGHIRRHGRRHGGHGRHGH